MADNQMENEQDPGASTQMFRAFVDEGTTTGAAPKSNTRTVAIVAGVVVVIAVVIALLVL
jgi:hypothetical protein